MKKIRATTTTITKETWYDETTKITRIKRVEWEMNWNTETEEEEWIKHTKWEKR